VASSGDGSARCCPPALRAVLSDATVAKAGVSVRNDALELYRWDCGGDPTTRVRLRSRMDLGGLCGGTDAVPRGLGTLSSDVLGLNLAKSRRLAMSDWGRRSLTTNQVVYAARDAWVAATVYQALRRAAAENGGDWSPAAVLRDVIGRERSMDEVHLRAVTRRAVRKEIKSIGGSDKIERERLLRHSRDLRSLMQELRPDPIPEFCGCDFGLDWEKL